MTTTSPQNRSTSRPAAPQARTLTGKAVGSTARWADDRFAGATFVRNSLNKVFPDHWSFMLGEIALYSFIVLLLTGTFLTFFYDPSIAKVVYHGSYVPLRGVTMTQAYESSLRISFDVRGGLIIRQIHHWAALLFLASISVHTLRVFFTGAFRKPRELNWVVGALILQISLLEGFAGYSLPDDLLSGTGLRIGFSIVEAIPVVGTYLGFFVFGGNYPGPQFIPRLYTIHVLLIPGVLLALITVHMMLLWHQKHTQFPGPGKTETNVVGHRFYPVFMAKGGAFFFLVFAVMAFLGGLFQINPIWLYGPYNPAQVSAGSQPDWYIGWLDGAIRLMPNWETRLLHHTISWNIFVPGLALPGLVLGALTLYPFIEAWATKDRAYHNLLDRPRNRPVRTGLGMMSLSFYAVLYIAGANDIIAHTFHLSINFLTWLLRACVVVVPPLTFWATKRFCLGLQRKDRELAEHGHETGVIKRLPSGEYVEVHAPIEPDLRALLAARADGTRIPRELRAGRRGGAAEGVRRKVGGFYADAAPLPLPEAHDAHHDDSHALEPGELEAPVD